MHLLGLVSLLSGSGCSVRSIDWCLHLVEPGLRSAGTGLHLQAQAAGEPLHTHTRTHVVSWFCFVLGVCCGWLRAQADGEPLHTHEHMWLHGIFGEVGAIGLVYKRKLLVRLCTHTHTHKHMWLHAFGFFWGFSCDCPVANGIP